MGVCTSEITNETKKESVEKLSFPENQPVMEPSETDTSLDEFLTSLCRRILGSEIQNSFVEYDYPKLEKKNKLYQAIKSYTIEHPETPDRIPGVLSPKETSASPTFYSKFVTDHPRINIKRIGDIKMGGNHYTKGRGAYHDGTYFLRFTVYFEKTHKKQGGSG